MQKGTKVRIFCCYSLTGSKCIIFKQSLKFQRPWMTFNVWLCRDQLNCKEKRAAWVLIFPLLSHLKIPTFTHFHGWLLIRDLCLWSLHLDFGCWRTLRLFIQQDEPKCLSSQQTKRPGFPKESSLMLMICSQQEQHLLHGLRKRLTYCHCFYNGWFFLVGNW